MTRTEVNQVLTFTAKPSTPETVADYETRAQALAEALPFIQQFRGRTIVIKLGGAAIEAGDARAVLEDVVLLHVVGIRTVLVHGGGPAITAWQSRLGLETRFIDGLRVTDAATMEVARMVLTGKVGPELVSTIQSLGGSAVGISGEDGPSLYARPRLGSGGEALGLVGDVDHVDGSLIATILDSGRIPVVASVGVDAAGTAYNINADSVAAELAATLNASKLVLLSDVAGICDADGSLISTMDAPQARALIADGTVRGGMIPKLEAALRALDCCDAVHVLDGRTAHALLLELLTAAGIGTMIKRGAT